MQCKSLVENWVDKLFDINNQMFRLCEINVLTNNFIKIFNIATSCVEMISWLLTWSLIPDICCYWYDVAFSFWWKVGSYNYFWSCTLNIWSIFIKWIIVMIILLTFVCWIVVSLMLKVNIYLLFYILQLK